jgi:hypothetical protein
LIATALLLGICVIAILVSPFAALPDAALRAQSRANLLRLALALIVVSCPFLLFYLRHLTALGALAHESLRGCLLEPHCSRHSAVLIC